MVKLTQILTRRTITAVSSCILLMLAGFHSDTKHRVGVSVKNRHFLKDTVGDNLRSAIVKLQIPNLSVTEIQLVTGSYTPKALPLQLLASPNFTG